MRTANLADQSVVFTCLAGLAVTHPNLPAPYLTLSRHLPQEVAVQLDSPAAVEAWREVLGVAPDRVVADRIGDRPSLEFKSRAFGVHFFVYAVYTPATQPVGAT
ncbi:hypothetical protein [Streptomyces adustus]|uniref:hypothetical protein n=1 Tax=Streptomyces adustus TaxID=1609272 RepID=UPI003721F3B9